MNPDPFEALAREIVEHESNRTYTEKGWLPLFQASANAKIVIVGQAPGRKAQESGLPWNDLSGTKLMSWLGVTEAQFRDPLLLAHIPMDFYYPGKGSSGDLPPRKDFAPHWHPRFQKLMPGVALTVLIGNYAHAYYLLEKQRTLTETVQNYRAYLPNFFPVVHPSPLNFRWFAKHAWFEQEVVPELQERVQSILLID